MLGIKTIKVLKLSKNKIIKRVQRTYSLKDWISFIYNSDFIITDSFHGCVFSILFKKEFLVLTNNIGGNARIDSLLNLFDLKERKIVQGESFDKINIKNINWEKVELILNKNKTLSCNLLKSALE